MQAFESDINYLRLTQQMSYDNNWKVRKLFAQIVYEYLEPTKEFEDSKDEEDEEEEKKSQGREAASIGRGSDISVQLSRNNKSQSKSSSKQKQILQISNKA